MLLILIVSAIVQAMSVAEQLFYASGVPVAISDGEFDWDYIFAKDVYDAIDLYSANETVLFNICKTDTDINVVRYARATYLLKYGVTEFPALEGPYTAPDSFPDFVFTGTNLTEFSEQFAFVIRTFFGNLTDNSTQSNSTIPINATELILQKREDDDDKKDAMERLSNTGVINFKEKVSEKTIRETYGEAGVSLFKTSSKGMVAYFAPSAETLSALAESLFDTAREFYTAMTGKDSGPKVPTKYKQYQELNRLMLVNVLATIASAGKDVPYTNYEYISNTIQMTQEQAQDNVTPDKILKAFSNSLKSKPDYKANVDAFIANAGEFMKKLNDPGAFSTIMMGLYMHVPLTNDKGYSDGDWSVGFPFLKEQGKLGIKSVIVVMENKDFLDTIAFVENLIGEPDALNLPERQLFGIMLNVYKDAIISGVTIDELVIVYTMAENVDKELGEFFRAGVRNIIRSIYPQDAADKMIDILNSKDNDKSNRMMNLDRLHTQNRENGGKIDGTFYSAQLNKGCSPSSSGSLVRRDGGSCSSSGLHAQRPGNTRKPCSTKQCSRNNAKLLPKVVLQKLQDMGLISPNANLDEPLIGEDLVEGAGDDEGSIARAFTLLNLDNLDDGAVTQIMNTMAGEIPQTDVEDGDSEYHLAVKGLYNTLLNTKNPDGFSRVKFRSVKPKNRNTMFNEMLKDLQQHDPKVNANGNADINDPSTWYQADTPEEARNAIANLARKNPSQATRGYLTNEMLAAHDEPFVKEHAEFVDYMIEGDNTIVKISELTSPDDQVNLLLYDVLSIIKELTGDPDILPNEDLLIRGIYTNSDAILSIKNALNAMQFDSVELNVKLNLAKKRMGKVGSIVHNELEDKLIEGDPPSSKDVSMVENAYAVNEGVDATYDIPVSNMEKYVSRSLDAASTISRMVARKLTKVRNAMLSKLSRFTTRKRLPQTFRTNSFASKKTD